MSLRAERPAARSRAGSRRRWAAAALLISVALLSIGCASGPDAGGASGDRSSGSAMGPVHPAASRTEGGAAPADDSAATPAAPPLTTAIGAVLERPSEDEIPFIVTPDHVTVAMLEIAGVGPQDHLIDLGSGDGRIVITAARRFGATGLGVEIVPDLVARSQRYAERAGVATRTAFREEDLFTTDLAPASVVTMYLLPDINLRLRPRLLALAPGTRVVSHDWDMGDWRPDRSVVLPVPDKPVGREKLSRVHLWHVPAPVEGRWCAAAPDGTPRELELQRRHQHIESARLREGLQDQGRSWTAVGRIDGGQVALQGLGEDGARLVWAQAAGQAPTLQVVEASGQWRAWAGTVLTACPAPAEQPPTMDRATRPAAPPAATRR